MHPCPNDLVARLRESARQARQAREIDAAQAHMLYAADALRAAATIAHGQAAGTQLRRLLSASAEIDDIISEIVEDCENDPDPFPLN